MPMEAARGPRKKSPHADQRRDILEAAKSLFRQRGYQGVSMNDIVTTCGFKKPTIYHYFGDKEGLFTEVMDALMSRGQQFITQNLKPGMTLREKLAFLAEGYYQNSPVSLMSMLRDSGTFVNEQHKQRLVEIYREKVLQPLVHLFEQAAREGDITQEVPPAHLAMIYLSLLDAVNTQKILTEGRAYNFSKITEDVIQVFFQGINKPAHAS